MYEKADLRVLFLARPTFGLFVEVLKPNPRFQLEFLHSTTKRNIEDRHRNTEDEHFVSNLVALEL